jgi:DNA-binding protein YbaB
MLNPFKQLGDLNQMRQQAMKMQQELAAETIIVEKGDIHIEISGDQKVKTISVGGVPDNIMLDAVNEAIRKSQELAARKLQQISGGLGGLIGK